MAAVRSYLALSRQLEQELATAAPGDLVASENDLAHRFRVSRLTARAALQELERRHLVRRVQGRGTFVARRLDYKVSSDGPASFTEIVREAGGEPLTTTDAVVVRPATALERRHLALPARSKVVELRRRRWLGAEPVGVGTSVLPVSVVPDFAARYEDGASLYGVLAETYGLEPRRSWFRCEVSTAPEDVADELELRGRPELFHNQGRLDSRRLGIPIEVNDGWLRTDVFNVVIEISSFT